MSVIMPLRASGSLKWKHICFHVLLVLALTVFKQAGSQVKIYHNHFALHIPNGPDEAESIAQKHGFINRGQIGNVENHFLFEHHSIRPRWTNYSLDHHETLRQEPGVRWFEQQHEKRRVKRDFHTLNMPDPMFKDQWFLNHGAIDGSDMNVQPAWMKGYTGKRVVVTILDDGIQSNHPDLQLNYDPLASTDINGNDDDPMPQDNNDNKHGTRCAGEVAAEAFNNICGVGVAYNASIGGVRMLDGLVNDAVEARALSLRPDHIDIYSASWGPEDDGKTVDGPGPLAKKAFINGVKYGRNGKGSIFVWASGNGGRRVDNCNCDGYTNSIFTLSISSASQGGKKPWYLEECSSTLATTYSSGTPGHDASIVTVDQDAKLRPDKICTASHTGTSASAPIAAGVCALALEANPNLTWRDMQHIVVLTSNPNPLMVESGWKTNAVGRKYSHKFGYGLMDANAMVEVAKVWPGSGPLAICETDTITLDQPIPSDPSRVARASMKTNACGQTSSEIRYLEHVQCKLSLHYHPRGALQIVLTSPSGTKSSLLLPRPRDTTNAGFEDWPFLSVHFWGEPANGTWTIEVNHSPSVKGTGQSKGVLKKWKMLFYGTRESPLKDPSLVSEFGSFLGEDPNLDSEMMDEPVDVSGNNGQHTSWSSGSLSSYPYLLNHSNLLDAKEPLNQYDVSSSSSEVDLSSKSRSCHPQCKDNQCSGPKPTECLACKNFKFGNVCVDRCPLTTYSSIRGTCQACHPSCQTCFGPNPNDCLSCGNSLFLLTNQSTCIKGSCPLGYRQRPSSNECVPCPSHCESCTEASEVHNLIESPRTLYKHPQETSVVCLKCQQGLVRSVLENKCMSSCPGGFYLNQETRACDPCHESCATCIGSLPTQCSLCQDHTFYFERKCVEKCPIGFRPDVNRQECVPCPQGCGKCTSDQKCIKCKEEWTFAHGEQVCIPEISILCGKGSFRADENVGCEPCGSNCRSCAETKENCLTCPMNQALHLFTCIDHECPRGTFHDEKMRECRPCPHVCTECESFDHCTNCHLGHALNAQGRCVTSCKPDEYQTSEQLCRPCHESCSTCQGPTDKDCLSCPESNKYLSSIGQCLEQCSRGFVDEKGQCQACHPSCASCHGPSPFQCSTCPSGRKLGPDGTCQSCEPRKFYDGHSNDCLLCHESCGTCSGPQDSDCLSCHVPLVLDTWNGTCVPCCQSLDERHCCTCSPSKEKCLKPSKKILSRKRSSVGISLSDEVLSNPSRSVFLYGTLLTTMVVMSLLVVRYFKRGKLLGRPSLNGVGRRRPRRRRQSSQDLSRTNYQKLLTEEDLAGGINVGSIPKRPRYLDDHLPLQPRKYYPIEAVEMSKELFKRRVQIRTDEIIRHGREQIPRRSDFLEWNYDSELFAFSVRLGEKFDDSKIREAFVDQSHVEMEAERHRALEMGSEDEFAITSNDRLAEIGSKFLTETLEAYVRFAFPFWPEEGVQALVAFLNSKEVQAEISFHIGTRDLIFAKDYPPDMPTYAKVFRALVGVLVESGQEDKAKRFVYDLVVPQLHVQDINEIWDIRDPMRLLMTILKNEGRSEPESRLLWVSGLDTIMACYHVGIYVDKELIGQGPGESADIAEEMATRDALRRMFRSDESMPMIPMGDYLDPNQIKAVSKPNPSASEWSQEKVLRNLQTI